MSEGEVKADIHPSGNEFWAEVIGLNGCYTQGSNYSKVIANLRDAHELCADSPTAAAPAPIALELEPGTTIAELIAQLSTAGWIESGATSENHQLLTHPVSGAILSVLRDPTTVLNQGLCKALIQHFSASPP